MCLVLAFLTPGLLGFHFSKPKAAQSACIRFCFAFSGFKRFKGKTTWVKRRWPWSGMIILGSTMSMHLGHLKLFRAGVCFWGVTFSGCFEIAMFGLLCLLVLCWMVSFYVLILWSIKSPLSYFERNVTSLPKSHLIRNFPNNSNCTFARPCWFGWSALQCTSL